MATSNSTATAPAATMPPAAEYLTRRQAADYICAELGRPMSFSTATKLAALREFAEPAIYWGRRPLYTRESLRKWVEGRCRPNKQREETSAAANPNPPPRPRGRPRRQRSTAGAAP